MRITRSAFYLECVGVTFVLFMMLCSFFGVGLAVYFQESAINIGVWLTDYSYAVLTSAQLPLFPSLDAQFKLWVVIAFASAWAISVSTIWFFKIRRFDNALFKHLDGPKILVGKQAIKHFCKAALDENKQGLYLHPKIKIPNIFEAANVLVWGMQGSGKSNLIKYILNQIISDREEKVFIYDIKGEYTQLFLNQEAILLSPTDARSANWDLCKDITTVGLAEVFAESVISKSATSESFWVDSARVVLVGTISALINEYKHWSWADLAEKLFSSDESLSMLLKKHFPPAASLIKPDDKTTASIRSMIATQLSWIRSFSDDLSSNERSFAVSEWLRDKSKKTVIFKGEINSPIMSQAYFTALFSVLSNYVLSRSDDDAEPIWLVIDELATINKNKSIENWLALGRSKGCRTLAGIQLLSQLQSIFGRDDASTILGLFGNVITFRLAVNGEAKEVASKSFGTRRIEYQSASISSKGEKSHSLPQENVPVIKPEDIVSLPQPSLKNGIQGFLQISGLNAVYRLNWPIVRDLKKIAKASVLKPQTGTPVQLKQSNKLNRRPVK